MIRNKTSELYYIFRNLHRWALELDSTYWLFIKENCTKCRNSKQTKTLSPHVHHEYVILFINIISFTVLYIVNLWANTYSTCLNKLRILQKKAIRIITQSHHSDPLFSKLKLLKLDDLYKHQLDIFLYKSTKGLFPDTMSSMVIPIHNVHDHNLRNQNGYYIQHVRTNCR